MDWYVNLKYGDWKDLERQCKEFAESAHGKGSEYYHKSFVIQLQDDRIEFHGPNVKARYEENLAERTTDD